HPAAAFGVGQSRSQIADYTAANTLGTANLLQAMLNTNYHTEKLIVASSMSIYGEGEYSCSECGEVAPARRSTQQVQQKKWEPVCPYCSRAVRPVATRETKPLNCSSIYALSKKDQEEMVLLFGRTYQIPAVALRYFNIYGTRQALSNPYTGVVAIFASRLLNQKPPLVFEDGRQRRDFVSVHDVAEANWIAANSEAGDGEVVNLGSGASVDVLAVG